VLGNLGSNTLIGPGLAMLDFTLSKAFPIREGVQVQFRVDGFNVLNRVNLAMPDNLLFQATGQANVFAPRGAAGRITATSTTARELQFGLKLVF
jgi:hypothetical protein